MAAGASPNATSPCKRRRTPRQRQRLRRNLLPKSGREEHGHELWRQRTPEERAALKRLAASADPLLPDEAALQLVREGYLERKGDKVSITVPLFKEWIVDSKGTAE